VHAVFFFNQGIHGRDHSKKMNVEMFPAADYHLKRSGSRKSCDCRYGFVLNHHWDLNASMLVS
jgi:hypothetical protein